MRIALLAIAATFAVGGNLWLAADSPDIVFKSRQELLSSRRLARTDHTILAVKNEYFKRAIRETAAAGETPDLVTSPCA